MPEDETNLEDNSMQRFIVEIDICDFIRKLPDPERDLCEDLIIDGTSVKTAAEQRGVSSKTILRHARRALAPLAQSYDIKGAEKYADKDKDGEEPTETQIPPSNRPEDSPASTDGGTSAGPSGTPPGGSTTGEVIEKSDTLSFFSPGPGGRKKCSRK